MPRVAFVYCYLFRSGHITHRGCCAYQDARAQKQNTDALEKQINERLEGVLSRWLLLKNNVMPEAATGTTAEK